MIYYNKYTAPKLWLDNSVHDPKSNKRDRKYVKAPEPGRVNALSLPLIKVLALLVKSNLELYSSKFNLKENITLKNLTKSCEYLIYNREVQVNSKIILSKRYPVSYTDVLTLGDQNFIVNYHKGYQKTTVSFEKPSSEVRQTIKKWFLKTEKNIRFLKVLVFQNKIYNFEIDSSDQVYVDFLGTSMSLKEFIALLKRPFSFFIVDTNTFAIKGLSCYFVENTYGNKFEVIALCGKHQFKTFVLEDLYDFYMPYGSQVGSTLNKYTKIILNDGSKKRTTIIKNKDLLKRYALKYNA